MRIDFSQVKADAVGKWCGIYASLGIDVGTNPRVHYKCPLCGAKAFRMDDKEGNGTFICKCMCGDGWKLVQTVLGCDFKEAIEQVAPLLGAVKVTDRPEEKPVNPDMLRKMFIESRPVTHDNFVGQYLKYRGLSTFPSVLRYHPSCWDMETRRNYPTMLAVVHDHKEKAVTMHRTFLDMVTCGKAKIEKPKKVMPCLKPSSGGAIRLFPAGKILGIAEGIETAIAAHEIFGHPVWSAMNTSGMKSFTPPLGVEQVVIYSDNDANYAGQAAAYALAHRLSVHEKIRCEIKIPSKAGWDWLDELESMRLK